MGKKVTEEAEAAKPEANRKALIATVAGIIAVAAPSVLSAYHTAKKEWTAQLKEEQKARAKQEKEMQELVRTNKHDIDLLRESIRGLRMELASTRRQVVPVVVQLSSAMKKINKQVRKNKLALQPEPHKLQMSPARRSIRKRHAF